MTYLPRKDAQHVLPPKMFLGKMFLGGNYFGPVNIKGTRAMLLHSGISVKERTRFELDAVRVLFHSTLSSSQLHCV